MKMTALKLVSITMTALLLGACDKTASPEKTVLVDVKNRTIISAPAAIKPALTPLVIETASPDQAVKSWWRVLDLREKNNTEKCNAQLKSTTPPFAAYLPKVVQGEVLRTLTAKEQVCTEDLYEREIQEVKAESETRAIVFATIKNVTPIPPGAG
jgi:hypothetical protein